MTHGLPGFAGAAVIVGLGLAACGGPSGAGVSVPIGPDSSLTLCSRLGFVPGTSALATCTAKIDDLTRQQRGNQSRCEGIRQRALSPRFPAVGTGSTIANADADYQSCMSGGLVPPAQLDLPTGGSTTCRLTQDEIVCN